MQTQVAFRYISFIFLISFTAPTPIPEHPNFSAVLFKGGTFRFNCQDLDKVISSTQQSPFRIFFLYIISL